MASAPRVAMTLTQDWHAVPGGTAVAANALAAALETTDEADVVGVVPRGRRPVASAVPPVPTVALPLPVPYLYDFWHHVRRPRITSVTDKVDLVHLTVPIAAPPERIPTVATVHDLLPVTMPELFRRRGVRLMTRGLDRIRREAAAVIVPAELMREEFVEHGFDPARLHVVPLGVEPPPRPTPAEVRELLARLGLEEPFVLFVGTAEPRKGLDVLVDALARLGRDDVTLALVGPAGWGDLGTSLDALGERVRRLGYLPTNELRLLQSAAPVTCLPSRAEGFGLPVLEAMACGSPVVTTAGTTMEEVAGGAALLVPVGDAPALADALEAVLDDPSTAGRLADLGRRRAAEFTWERTARAVGRVYREVLG